mmetsp:Transcript_67054/g.143482  ORF Transcript_67054/g.143482 Transcript_67054/m.143482 type:complete len:156 (+) Transcript_67054:56-523(+)
MSRHSYGVAWHQDFRRPSHNSTSTGEGLPKRAPMGGCGFTGIPGDFPPERQKWYTEHVPAAGAATQLFSTQKKTRTFTSLCDKHLGASASAPTLHLGPAAGTGGPQGLMHGERENSHTLLNHGRIRAVPETLRTAGVSAFDMRRFQETNTAVGFL